MLSREKAMELIKQHVKRKNIIKHMLATEAVMREFAKRFNEDEELWGIAGLLHDLDYDYTFESPEKHGFMTIELLKDHDVPEEVKNAILAHCEHKKREKLIEKAIYAADPVTGFIVAAVLIRKGTKLKDLTVDFLKNRFKEKSFARGASRENMLSCEEFGLSLDEFLSLSLKAMQGISKELGL
ncbi:phosphohydrolase [Kosmotoga arenicorallina S304]|uniref:Phosphohydrolase n=1 Tax=Kosmotoga arenicorallina S304 TaxID=1453497 RepID=A0A176K0M2_9BACT|nr:HD domain-containing protein [Kosmotoga arenicorallina]OAA29725.1 phosphohydrolase [Kosmotoga arenicorallina S304]